MKIEPIDAVKEFEKLNKNPGHPPTAEEFNAALSELARAAQADALRQVTEMMKGYSNFQVIENKEIKE